MEAFIDKVVVLDRVWHHYSMSLAALFSPFGAAKLSAFNKFPACIFFLPKHLEIDEKFCISDFVENTLARK